MVSRNKRLNIVQDVTKWALVTEAKESTFHLILKLKKKEKKNKRKTEDIVATRNMHLDLVLFCGQFYQQIAVV